jgi:Permuted papain-like amidase enzyme, YaeF/YiiX, C92 family
MNWKTYYSVRDTIRTGDVFFTNSKCITSSVIDFFTHSHISHVGFFMWIGRRLFVIESMQGRGVRMILASERFGKEPLIVLQTRGFNEDLALQHLGQGYNLLGAILSPFVRMPSHKVYCAEFVADCLGLKETDILNGDEYFEYFFERDIYPIDVYNFLKKSTSNTMCS